MGHQGRLRIVRERELLRGPLEAELAQRHAERRISAVENVAGRGELADDVLAHSWFLRSLSGKQQNNVHSAKSERSSTPT